MTSAVDFYIHIRILTTSKATPEVQLNLSCSQCRRLIVAKIESRGKGGGGTAVAKAVLLTARKLVVEPRRMYNYLMLL